MNKCPKNMDEAVKKLTFLKKKCFFKGSIASPEQSNRLVICSLWIENSLCKENLVYLFCSMSINVSKCPKIWVKQAKRPQKF